LHLKYIGTKGQQAVIAAFLKNETNREEWVNPDNTPKSVSHSYKYNPKEQLVSKAYIRHQQGNSSIVEFLFEDDRVIRSTGYKEGEISGYTDYTYDSNGNLTMKEKYHSSPEGMELSTTTEYEYDNMQNPYQSFKRLITPGIYTNQNNIVKETYTIHFEVDASIEKVQITENSYEYNDEGYPVKVNGIKEYVYNLLKLMSSYIQNPSYESRIKTHTDCLFGINRL